MTFRHPSPFQGSLAAAGAAILWGYSLFFAPEAKAACVQSGANVDCTGVDVDGFRSPQTLTVHIRPGAFVQNVISNDVIGICPLSLPAIEAGQSSSVLNEGAISTGGVCGFGIVVSDNASVVNLGTIRTAHLVASGIIAGVNSSIRNGGSISTVFQSSSGILGDRGARVTTDASSLITTEGGGSNGIEVGASSSITHSGVITITGDASMGMDAGSGSVLTNNGAITTSANNSMGVRIAGGSLINNGSIRSVLAGPAFALTPTIGVSIVGSEASFTNTSTGSITATHIGVRLSGTQGAEFSNSGRIEVSPAIVYDGSISANGAAVLIGGGLGVAMANSGSIVARDGLPAIRSLGPRVDLQNRGTIVGDVILGDGNDTIAYEESSSIDGLVDFGGGDDTLIFRAGGVLARPVMNVEFLTKSGGGALIFGRDLAVGRQITVFGGSEILIDRGVRVTAPLTDSIGVIRGHGTLAGTLNNSGTLAPGTASEKGTLTITGAFRQFENGKIAIRLSPDGTSDKILIGGPATFAGGLVVTYDLRAGLDFEDGQRFDVVSPLGSTMASSGELTLTAPQSTFLIPTLVRNTNGGFAVEIDRRSYETAGITESQKSAGRMLDRLRSASPPGLSATLTQLDAATSDAATAILAGLAPEAPGGVQNLSLMALDRFTDSVHGRAPIPRGTGRFAWARGFTKSGHSRDASSRADYDLHGGIAGVEVNLSDLGVGVAAARIEGDFARGTDLAAYDASIFGLTAHYSWSDLDLDAAIAYGTGSPSMRRVRMANGVSEALAAEGEAELWSISLNGAFTKAMGPVALVPHVGVNYHRAGLDAIDERQPLAVQTVAADAESLRGRVGLGVSASAGRFRPYGDLSLSVELLERQPKIAAGLIGAAGSDFELLGDARRRVAAEAEAGLAVTITPSVEAYVSGEIAANDLLAGRALTAGLTFRW